MVPGGLQKMAIFSLVERPATDNGFVISLYDSSQARRSTLPQKQVLKACALEG